MSDQSPHGDDASDRSPVELTRERLRSVVGRVAGDIDDATPPRTFVVTDDVRVLLAAAERLLAQKAASAEEMAEIHREATREWSDPMRNRRNRSLREIDFRACERRLLLPADETGGRQ